MFLEWFPIALGLGLCLHLFTKSILGEKPSPAPKKKTKKYLIVEE
jgi:hypothetical protein